MKMQLEKQRWVTRVAPPGLLLLGVILCSSVFPSQAVAGLILDAELRLTYEDNVVGLLSDQPQGKGGSGGMLFARGLGGGRGMPGGSGSAGSGPTGDYSATLFAEAGGYRDMGKSSEVFAKGFASHTAYETYSDLDSTIAGVSAGFTTRLNSIFSTRAAIVGKIKRFGDTDRNSNAYGVDLGLKEKLTPSFWFREYVQYENNMADLSAYSFTGTTFGIGAGYSLTKTVLATAGYSYLDQTYDVTPAAGMKTQTAYLGIDFDVIDNWTVSGEIDRQTSKDDTIGTTTTNNIFSLAVRFSY